LTFTTTMGLISKIEDKLSGPSSAQKEAEKKAVKQDAQDRLQGQSGSYDSPGANHGSHGTSGLDSTGTSGLTSGSYDTQSVPHNHGHPDFTDNTSARKGTVNPTGISTYETEPSFGTQETRTGPTAAGGHQPGGVGYGSATGIGGGAAGGALGDNTTQGRDTGAPTTTTSKHHHHHGHGHGHGTDSLQREEYPAESGTYAGSNLSSVTNPNYRAAQVPTGTTTGGNSYGTSDRAATGAGIGGISSTEGPYSSYGANQTGRTGRQ